MTPPTSNRALERHACHFGVRPDRVDPRAVVQVFSRPAIEEICTGKGDTRAASALGQLRRQGALDGEACRGAAVVALFDWLARHYRSEAVFKNALANKLLFGRHNPTTASLIQEFRVGRSKADTVLVNGSVTAYEIKTALDSTQKLQKQLADYRRAFPMIYVVTDEKISSRYEALFEGTAVGVVTLKRRNGRLSVTREATYDARHLDSETLLRTLRKPEYTEVVRQVTGSIPDVPSGKFFRECLRQVSDVDPTDVHTLWRAELKKRRLQAPDGMSNEDIRPLRHICVDINPSEAELRRLRSWLAQPVR